MVKVKVISVRVKLKVSNPCPISQHHVRLLQMPLSEMFFLHLPADLYSPPAWSLQCGLTLPVPLHWDTSTMKARILECNVLVIDGFQATQKSVWHRLGAVKLV